MAKPKEIEQSVQKIYDAVGGDDNIRSLTHCITRLRFQLKDWNKVDDNVVKKIPGVLGVNRQNGQYQIIIGNQVADYYDALVKIGNFAANGEVPADEGQDDLHQHKNWFDRFAGFISSCMSPLIPALIGGGMIKVILIICTTAGWLTTKDQNYILLSAMGDAPFYFLPVELAYTAAKYFRVDRMIAVAIGGVLIYPNFIKLVNAGGAIHLFGIPVTPVSYSSSVIPILLTVWAMKYIEHWIDAICPAFIKSILKPLLELLVMSFLALVVLGPVGNWIGDGLSIVMVAINKHVSWLAMGLMSAFMPLIVMTGMHWAFAPIFLAASVAHPDSLILPAMLASNIAEGAACLAVAIKTKNKNVRQVASAASISALLAGVTEPALYGVTLKSRKPLYTAMVSGGIVGIFTGIVHLKSFAFAVPAFLSLPQFINKALPHNITYAVIIAIASLVLTFILTYIFGYSDKMMGVTPDGAEVATAADGADATADVNVSQPTANQSSNLEPGAKDTKKVYSPVKGHLIPLEQVKDNVFAKKMMGDGAAIEPTDGKIYAPFDAKVVTVFLTKHAIGLKSKDGIELMIHIGLDTVELKGKPFTQHVAAGDEVKKGQLLMDVDLKAIQDAGYDTTTPVIVTNTKDFVDVEAAKPGNVTTDDIVLYVI